MFTQNNTTGYTDAQLASLNAELAQRLEGAHEHDKTDIEQAFADEVASR